MRVWDIPVSQLCNKHLVAQHNEIHTIYSIITNNKKGFAHHPEVMRWRDKLGSLWVMHSVTIMEMEHRGMKHNSPFADTVYGGQYPCSWQSVEVQKDLLRAKGCGCKV